MRLPRPEGERATHQIVQARYFIVAYVSLGYLSITMFIKLTIFSSCFGVKAASYGVAKYIRAAAVASHNGL